MAKKCLKQRDNQELTLFVPGNQSCPHLLYIATPCQLPLPWVPLALGLMWACFPGYSAKALPQQAWRLCLRDCEGGEGAELRTGEIEITNEITVSAWRTLCFNEGHQLERILSLYNINRNNWVLWDPLEYQPYRGEKQFRKPSEDGIEYWKMRKS